MAVARISSLVVLLSLPPSASANTPSDAPPQPERALQQSSDPLQRESAALALGAGGSRAAISMLSARLKDDQNRWVRARCAEALGLIGDPAAASPLKDALTREKHPRVRRSIAEALVRLGQRQGVLELLWQLKSGNQHTKAEVTQFLVRTTTQPLAQDSAAWWRFFGGRGADLLKRRPTGSPVLKQINGAVHLPGGDTTLPSVHGERISRWQLICAVRLGLHPRGAAITVETLQRFERERGPLPDGCLVLIDANWPANPQSPRPVPQQGKDLPAADRGKGPKPALAAGPGLTAAAAQYLLRASPGIRGIGINAPNLDPPAGAGQPVRKLLRERKLLAIEGLSGLRTLSVERFRLLVVNRSTANSGTVSALLLALLN